MANEKKNICLSEANKIRDQLKADGFQAFVPKASETNAEIVVEWMNAERLRGKLKYLLKCGCDLGPYEIREMGTRRFENLDPAHEDIVAKSVEFIKECLPPEAKQRK